MRLYPIPHGKDVADETSHASAIIAVPSKRDEGEWKSTGSIWTHLSSYAAESRLGELVAEKFLAARDNLPSHPRECCHPLDLDNYEHATKYFSISRKGSHVLRFGIKKI